jgi:ABC-type transport system substrate-binding protein
MLVRTVLVAAILLVACEPTDEAGQVYRHAMDGVPGSLDPAHAADVYSGALVVNLFDTLYRYRYLARPHRLAPNLAADFPEISEDGRIWTIRLRDDVRFVDDPAFPDGRGRRVTASDVVYSLRRHFDPATRSRTAWHWRGRIVGLDAWGASGADPDTEIEGLRAIDEHTVRIELVDPYPQLVDILALPPAAIVPVEAVEYYGREFGVHPVGSGPFRLTRIDETMAVLEPNPHFDRGPLDLSAEGYSAEQHARFNLSALDGRDYPFLDRLEIHFVTEPATRWSSFAAEGEVDYVLVPPEQTRRVLSSVEPLRFDPDIARRYHHRVQPETGFAFYGFNMANPEIGHHPDPKRARANRALRCAMRDAFDWPTRNRTFYNGLGRVFAGAIPPFLAEYDAEQAQLGIEHDPESARRRLAEHGWTADSLPTLVYGMEGSVQQRQMFEQFRAWMGDIGWLTEQLRPQVFVSFNELMRAIGERRLDLFLLGWTLSYPDAQYSLQIFYGPNAAPGANSFNYANPEFDRLFERASLMPAGPERTALYRRLNQIIIDDCVIIGSLARTRVHLWDRDLAMLPDREIVNGYFMRFVARID